MAWRGVAVAWRARQPYRRDELVGDIVDALFTDVAVKRVPGAPAHRRSPCNYIGSHGREGRGENDGTEHAVC